MTVRYKNRFERIRGLLVALGSVALIVFPFDSTGASEGNGKHFSIVKGSTIQMQPSGASFEIPLNWTKEYGAVNITPKQLENVRRGKGEWYRDYARVVNAALPFADCSVQAGTHAWDSGTFGGVQMRGYAVESSADEIEDRIAGRGLAAAKALPTATARNATLNRNEAGQWHRILIGYEAWFSDYGGKANVDFYVNAHESKTVVLVFMYAGESDHAPAIGQILKSFSWHALE